MRYDALRPVVKTGDLIFFSGRGLTSWLIKRATRSDFSHVGIVVRDPAFGVLLVESTTLSKMPDLWTGRRTEGVQAVYLSQRIATYQGAVWIARGKRPLERAEEERLARVLYELRQRPYERSYWTLARAALPNWLGGNGPDPSSLFCSELVAIALQAVGRLPMSPPADAYAPHELAWLADYVAPHAVTHTLARRD